MIFLVSIALSNRKDCLSTGCKILDKLLGGGIRCGGITELAGESSCGKTQICMQMSLMVQYPSLFGGLEAGEILKFSPLDIIILTNFYLVHFHLIVEIYLT